MLGKNTPYLAKDHEPVRCGAFGPAHGSFSFT